jgi:hypothetical protein
MTNFDFKKYLAENTLTRTTKLRSQILTEGEAAYEYEEGKKEGEEKSNYQKLIDAGYSENDAEDFADEFEQGGVKVPQKVKDILTNESVKPKMKKSELKAKIKEMVLAEMDGPAVVDSEYDFLKEIEDMLDEAKDEEADAEADTEAADDTTGEDTTAGDETVDTTVDVSTDEVDPNVKAVQDALTQAQAAAQQLGDPKLTDQIGNTITFFTRSHVVEKPTSVAEGEEMEEGYFGANNEVEELIDALEYETIDEFINDNPGVVTAILDWAADVPEFKSKMEASGLLEAKTKDLNENEGLGTPSDGMHNVILSYIKPDFRDKYPKDYKKYYTLLQSKAKPLSGPNKPETWAKFLKELVKNKVVSMDGLLKFSETHYNSGTGFEGLVNYLYKQGSPDIIEKIDNLSTQSENLNESMFPMLNKILK